MGADIILFLVFIGFSAFFSASETALFSLTPAKLHRIEHKYRTGAMVKELLKHPGRLLSTIVFGNMLVNIALASLAATIFVSRWGQKGMVFSVIISWTVILFFGEIFPKVFSIYTAARLAAARFLGSV